MDEQRILNIIKELGGRLPKFPDGRINYSDSDTAPVLTVFVKHKDKILLLKRSGKVGVYRGKWNTVAGYLDELKPVRGKVLEELGEELGVKESEVLFVHTGRPYEFTDELVKKTWLVHPVMVELKEKPKIRLDWEHVEFRWIKPEELADFDTVPNLGKSLNKLVFQKTQVP